MAGMPSMLYKYLSPEVTKKVLKTKALKWSSPCLFDDITEFQRVPKFSPSIDEGWREYPTFLLKAATGEKKIDIDRLKWPLARESYLAYCFALGCGVTKEELSKINHEHQNPPLDQRRREEQLFNDILHDIEHNRIRVVCFSEDEKNLRMWAHYANDHKGCALGFGYIPDKDGLLQNAKKVKYSDSTEDRIIGSGVDFWLYSEFIELAHRSFDVIALTKGEVWADQKEWRVVKHLPSGHYSDELASYEAFHSSELVSIVFGAKATDRFKGEVVNLLDKRFPGIAIYELRQHRGVTGVVPFAQNLSSKQMTQ